MLGRNLECKLLLLSRASGADQCAARSQTRHVAHQPGESGSLLRPALIALRESGCRARQPRQDKTRCKVCPRRSCEPVESIGSKDRDCRILAGIAESRWGLFRGASSLCPGQEKRTLQKLKVSRSENFLVIRFWRAGTIWQEQQHGILEA
jgi:hypothetical protein